MKQKVAIIIGAGPAGLTAAYELLKKTDVKPIVLEASSQVGGLSRTVEYKGNRIDIGGHRFFSKSDRVMAWWQEILPFEFGGARRSKSFDEAATLGAVRALDPEMIDNVMLRRSRLSRIYYLRSFFDYPVSLNFATLRNLGVIRIIKIVLSYLKTRLFPIKDEKSLEDFFINRFGKELYATFFRDYTHKVWGIPASKIKPEWGAQRIKGISISKVIMHALKGILSSKKTKSQKKLETSWINRFWYPKFGPGQMWEQTARKVKAGGGQVLMNHKVVGIDYEGDTISSVTVQDTQTGTTTTMEGDYFFSTMPVRELVAGMGDKVPANVKEVADGLKYRDFITVGLLLKKLHIKGRQGVQSMVPDNWIYIQESDVKVGRLQIFNNWSPYMVEDANNVWVGMEYFANEGDELWSMSEEELKKFGVDELCKIDMIKREDVLDATVIKVPKAYPVYFGTYDRFDEVKKFTAGINNLFLVGRNGMHKYNNQDHSMLAAMEAVDIIAQGVENKDMIWKVNTEKEYHESK